MMISIDMLYILTNEIRLIDLIMDGSGWTLTAKDLFYEC